jgi:catechol 2,3-dioxygenase-like lactoylglutathione lyase family enzyme
MSNNFHPSSPIFRVTSLTKSLDYYNDQLGFKTDWIHEDNFASVSRGQANIMLCQGDQGAGRAWIYIGIGDTEALYEEYLKKGAVIRQKPTNFSWALEMQVQDPDGNVIRFGSDPKKNRPTGPWLDMNGKEWK